MVCSLKSEIRLHKYYKNYNYSYLVEFICTDLSSGLGQMTIFIVRQMYYFVIKLLRAYGECLGTRRR
jgi:hypothetical protein